MKKLSFVIPCYRSESTITQVVDEIIETVGLNAEYDYEIILVSDCSPDNVYQIITRLANENPRIIGLELSRNFGQHAALMAGYRHCTGDVIISLDDDGQTPANELFVLVDKINEGYDVVYGSYQNIKQNAFRKLGSSANQFMMEKLLDKPKELYTTSFFAAKKFIIEEIIKYKNPYPYIGGLIFRASHNIASAPVSHRDRYVGKSGYTLKKLLSLWLNGFTAFSIKPLRFSSFFGVLIAITGFTYALVTVIRKIINPDIPAGWASTISILLIIGGMILCVLGMIGEYIGRMYICINESPQYVIRNKINTVDVKREYETALK